MKNKANNKVLLYSVIKIVCNPPLIDAIKRNDWLSQTNKNNKINEERKTKQIKQ